ncbi:hypothetical protein BD289DRAFT_261286 [Coniella lustricola]|uniref:Uncharacterized protein n=1 Tax=Coniella lustricola TaxID=2025994 RepID=A0A2T3A7U4_9PEZI|nr:hypothetical protein BD289DRAFT_261286 [Coniella lustricola]
MLPFDSCPTRQSSDSFTPCLSGCSLAAFKMALPTPTLLCDLSIGHSNVPGRLEARPTTLLPGILSVYRQMSPQLRTPTIVITGVDEDDDDEDDGSKTVTSLETAVTDGPDHNAIFDERFYPVRMRLMIPGANGGAIKYIYIEAEADTFPEGVYRFRANELELVLDKVPGFAWNHAVLRRRRENDVVVAVGGGTLKDQDAINISAIVAVADLKGDYVYTQFAMRPPAGLKQEAIWETKPQFEYTSLLKLSYSVGDHTMHDERLCVVTAANGAGMVDFSQKYVMKLALAPAQLPSLANEVALYRAVWEASSSVFAHTQAEEQQQSQQQGHQPPPAAVPVTPAIPMTPADLYLAAFSPDLTVNNPCCPPSPFSNPVSAFRLPRFIGLVVDGGSVVGILTEYINPRRGDIRTIDAEAGLKGIDREPYHYPSFHILAAYNQYHRSTVSGTTVSEAHGCGEGRGGQGLGGTASGLCERAVECNEHHHDPKPQPQNSEGGDGGGGDDGEQPEQPQHTPFSKPEERLDDRVLTLAALNELHARTHYTHGEPTVAGNFLVRTCGCCGCEQLFMVGFAHARFVGDEDTMEQCRVFHKEMDELWAHKEMKGKWSYKTIRDFWDSRKA